jgi:hypothetical protein
MPYPTFSPNASTANILNDVSGNSFVVHDFNEAQRQYFISRAPFFVRDVLLCAAYPLRFDLPGRTSFLIEHPHRTVELTVSLTGSISNYGGVTLSPAELVAGSATALTVNGYSIAYPYRFFSVSLAGGGSGFALNLTAVPDSSGSSLNDFALAIGTAGSGWEAGDLIAIGDPYFNGGVLRVDTVSAHPHPVATFTVVRPGKGYKEGVAQMGTHAAYISLSAMRA